MGAGGKAQTKQPPPPDPAWAALRPARALPSRPGARPHLPPLPPALAESTREAAEGSVRLASAEPPIGGQPGAGPGPPRRQVRSRRPRAQEVPSRRVSGWEAPAGRVGLPRPFCRRVRSWGRCRHEQDFKVLQGGRLGCQGPRGALAAGGAGPAAGDGGDAEQEAGVPGDEDRAGAGGSPAVWHQEQAR